MLKMERKIVIASHGNYSQGLAHAGNMICGDLPYELEAFTLLPGMSANDFVEKLEKEILSDMSAEKEYVILTDLFGASVCTAMCQLLKYENVKVFAGMNLNLLLMICIEYRQKIGEKEAHEIVEMAREGIRYVQLDPVIKEEF
ncbi:PTS system, IIa component [Bacillus cereus Rock3-44]|nr:PTS system, IIa component [Bacillus cereus Rock3-44]